MGTEVIHEVFILCPFWHTHENVSNDHDPHKHRHKFLECMSKSLVYVGIWIRTQWNFATNSQIRPRQLGRAESGRSSCRHHISWPCIPWVVVRVTIIMSYSRTVVVPTATRGFCSSLSSAMFLKPLRLTGVPTRRVLLMRRHDGQGTKMLLACLMPLMDE